MLHTLILELGPFCRSFFPEELWGIGIRYHPAVSNTETDGLCEHKYSWFDWTMCHKFQLYHKCQLCHQMCHWSVNVPVWHKCATSGSPGRSLFQHPIRISRFYRKWWCFLSIQPLYLTFQENLSRTVDGRAFIQGSNSGRLTSTRLSSCSVFLTISLLAFTVTAIRRMLVRRSLCTISLILVTVCGVETETDRPGNWSSSVPSQPSENLLYHSKTRGQDLSGCLKPSVWMSRLSL